MIRLLDAPQYRILQRVCEGDVFGARILSGAQMYGQYPFADIWVQEQDGIPTAAILKLDSALTVTVCAPPDWCELQEFFRMVSGESLLGERGVLERLGIGGTSGMVLYRANERKAHFPEPEENAGLKDVHELLCVCETDSFRPPKWEPFYLDVSHRIRHGGAHIETIRENGTLTACAMTLAETSGLAVIGAVAVHPEYRRRGLGGDVVERLMGRLAQERVAVLCSGPNTVFYKSLGFRGHSQWLQGSP